MTRRQCGLRWAFRLWAIVVTCALAVSVGLQGRSYVRCNAIGAVHWASCCPGLDRHDETSIDVTSCCEHRELAPLAKVGRALSAEWVEGAGHSLPATRPAAVAWPPAPYDMPPLPPRRWRNTSGPAPPPTAPERLALLSRYLC